jgi:predicted nucleic acid-binding protein
MTRAAYIDSSALVKLVVREPESASLRTYLRTRRPWVSSALARTEVRRALLPLGDSFVEAGSMVLARCDLVHVSNRVLDAAGTLPPDEIRSLDAIHLETTRSLGGDLGVIVTYDERMIAAASVLGLKIAHPGRRTPRRR